MIKILKYEIQRLLFNKFYIGLFIINGIYAWFILTSDIIAGVAHTAPFSPWSFGFYLTSVMPMLALTVLFLLTFFYSRNEKQVKILTSATSADATLYMLIRIAVVTLGFLLLCILVIVMSFCFYIIFFNYWNFSVYIIPVLIIILPCFMFVVGAGFLAGQFNSGFLYILMLIFIAMNFIQITDLSWDFFGKNYFSVIPALTQVTTGGEPEFVLNTEFLVVRAFYFIFGIVLLVVGVLRCKKRNR